RSRRRWQDHTRHRIARKHCKDQKSKCNFLFHVHRSLFLGMLKKFQDWSQVTDVDCQVLCTCPVILKDTRTFAQKTGAAVEFFSLEITCQQDVDSVNPDITPARLTDNISFFSHRVVNSNARFWVLFAVDVCHGEESVI